MSRRLIVTHHAPDLDAIGATWILKRFDSQHHADAKTAYVNPGEKITLEEAEKFQCQLHEVTHVDTGLGDFDHHQPEKALPNNSATSLVYDYVSKIHPDLKNDETLRTLVQHITDIDHFREVFWPESDHYRYVFSLHELIRGHEFTDPHNDDSQMHFGLQCLDNAYSALTQHIKAKQIIEQKGQSFDLKNAKAMAITTRNDDTIKIAQKQGYVLVIRKDAKDGHIRIKVRPDSEIILDKLYKVILEKDTKGTWFNHASGKMLLNGSRKSRNQRPSPLELETVVELVKELYD